MFGDEIDHLSHETYEILMHDSMCQQTYGEFGTPPTVPEPARQNTAVFHRVRKIKTAF